MKNEMNENVYHKKFRKYKTIIKRAIRKNAK